jgi:hypothetical protein
MTEQHRRTSDAEVFDRIMKLLDWVFQVQIRGNERAFIERTITGGWHNPDTSDHDLVAYLIQLHDTLFRIKPEHRDKLRAQVLKIFQRMFGLAEQNDRGRVLAAIYQSVEYLRVGCTEMHTLKSNPGLQPTVQPMQAMQPMQPMQAMQAMQPMQPMQPMQNPYPAGQPFGLGQPPAPVLPPVSTLLQQQVDAQRDIQQAVLKSNLNKMQHDACMTIIGNIK